MVKNKILVEDYNLHWVIDYQNEEIKIKNILKDKMVAIHHIGSTSVSGLSAKLIIDIIDL